MSSCYVCDVVVAVSQEHHVVPQSRGGTDGPTVVLCPTCHTATHSAARAMIAGKSPDKYLGYLDHDQRSRAMLLVKSIVLVETTLEDTRNPHPMLAVSLDHHCYIVALNMLQADRGFRSRDRLINAILRSIAARYGLIEDESSSEKLVRLSSLRKASSRRESR